MLTQSNLLSAILSSSGPADARNVSQQEVYLVWDASGEWAFVLATGWRDLHIRRLRGAGTRSILLMSRYAWRANWSYRSCSCHFDSEQTSLARILETFERHDPTQGMRQATIWGRNIARQFTHSVNSSKLSPNIQARISTSDDESIFRQRDYDGSSTCWKIFFRATTNNTWQKTLTVTVGWAVRVCASLHNNVC